MNKEYVFLKEIVCEHHPIYKTPEMKKIALKNPSHFNVPRLIEETMAHVGGYEFVDENHYDFSDGTECKTASVHPSPDKKWVDGKLYDNNYKATISNVRSKSGVSKAGDLRVCMYNPHEQNIIYFYIPATDLGTELTILGSGIGHIQTSYNINKKAIGGKYRKYIVNSFEELAKIKPKASPIKQVIINLDKYRNKKFNLTLEKPLQIKNYMV